MKKLVYISSLAVPHQIKLCQELNNYLNSEFWFYEYTGDRPKWWKIPLCSKCKIIPNVHRFFNRRYFSFKLLDMLNKYNPDIVMIGGFSIPGNYFAYKWAKKHGKKVIVFTEISRKNGKKRKKDLGWNILLNLYKDIDYIFTSNEDATNQFKHDFNLGEKVITTRYASDIDSYFSHDFRNKKEAYTYLFANRLIDIYNPLLAIEIFAEIYKRYPNSKLVMNSEGNLYNQCLLKIKELDIENRVTFLSSIKQWDELPKIYEQSDILIFPAKFSNGNFSIIEAMASGMGIVISNKIKGHGDMLKNGENCFILNPNKQEFVNAILKYINHPELFKKHAIINRDKVKHLSVKGTAKFLFDTFSKLGLLK